MTPEKRAAIVLTAAYLGAAATTGLALAVSLGWPDFLRGLMVGLLIVSLAILLLRKLRDEYFQQLWAAGASLAFVAVLGWITLLPFFEGFVDGLTGAPNAQNLPASWAGIVCLAAFFIGFHWKHLRSRP